MEGSFTVSLQYMFMYVTYHMDAPMAVSYDTVRYWLIVVSSNLQARVLEDTTSTQYLLLQH